ncbi:MAG: hypothetical protein K8S94_12650 [Planctomycetia bacterium]|nr:hypothetical protein [Planctomycetia bacterium]
MARRRSRTSATGGNMDSMLDTLTNVVGILIIVLVTVQLSTQEAANRIAAAVENIDPQEVANLEQAAIAAKAEADRLEAQVNQFQQPTQRDPAAEAAKLEAQAATAEAAAREAAAKAATLEKAKAAQAKAAQQAADDAARKAAEDLARAEAALKKTEEARLALAVELDNTPVPITPPAKEVRLPDPRPAPKDAKEVTVLCREGRIWVVDTPLLQEPAQKRAAFVVKSKKLDPDDDQWVSDGTIFSTEFNKMPVTAGDFRMTLKLVDGKWPRLILQRKNNSGERPEDFDKATGELARALRRHDAAGHYIRFYVWPDGFEAYLAARQVVAELGHAAGWEPQGTSDEFMIPLGKYPVGPKPPPSPSPPKPPTDVID